MNELLHAGIFKRRTNLKGSLYCKTFLVAGHIPVEAFQIISYFFDSKYHNNIITLICYFSLTNNCFSLISASIQSLPTVLRDTNNH